MALRRTMPTFAMRWDVREKSELGLQPRSIGATRVFVTPNPSPANAVYSLEDLADWYRRLGQLRDEVTGC